MPTIALRAAEAPSAISVSGANYRSKSQRDTYAVEGWQTDEDDEYDSYQQAVDRFDALLNQAGVDGWQIEHGWASRDNLLAARLTRSHADETFLQIIRVDLDDDCEADDP